MFDQNLANASETVNWRYNFDNRLFYAKQSDFNPGLVQIQNQILKIYTLQQSDIAYKKI